MAWETGRSILDLDLDFAILVSFFIVLYLPQV